MKILDMRLIKIRFEVAKSKNKQLLLIIQNGVSKSLL